MLLSTISSAGVLADECLGHYEQTTTEAACPHRLSIVRSSGLWDLALIDLDRRERFDNFLFGLGFGIEDDGSLEEIKGDISAEQASTSSIFKYGKEVLMKYDRSLNCDLPKARVIYSQERSEFPFEITVKSICEFAKN